MARIAAPDGSTRASQEVPLAYFPTYPATPGTHANLFSNIAVGDGTRVFKSGGAKGRGAHSGASTFGSGSWVCAASLTRANQAAAVAAPNLA